MIRSPPSLTFSEKEARHLRGGRWRYWTPPPCRRRINFASPTLSTSLSSPSILDTMQIFLDTTNRASTLNNDGHSDMSLESTRSTSLREMSSGALGYRASPDRWERFQPDNHKRVSVPSTSSKQGSSGTSTTITDLNVWEKLLDAPSPIVLTPMPNNVFTDPQREQNDQDYASRDDKYDAIGFRTPRYDEDDAIGFRTPGYDEDDAIGFRTPGYDEDDAIGFRTPRYDQDDAIGFRTPGYDEDDAIGFRTPRYDQDDSNDFRTPRDDQDNAIDFQTPRYDQDDSNDFRTPRDDQYDTIDSEYAGDDQDVGIDSEDPNTVHDIAGRYEFRTRRNEEWFGMMEDDRLEMSSLMDDILSKETTDGAKGYTSEARSLLQRGAESFLAETFRAANRIVEGRNDDTLRRGDLTTAAKIGRKRKRIEK